LGRFVHGSQLGVVKQHLSRFEAKAFLA
jgi:hypothetical protein